MRAVLWILGGGVALIGAAVLASPFLIGGDLAYSLGVAPDERETCKALSDEQAVDRAREWFAAKDERRRSGPAWRGRNPLELDVLSVERTNLTLVKFGKDGETRVTALIYDDCLVGWS